MSSIYDDIFVPLKSDLESFRNTYVMAPELWKKFSIGDLKGVDFRQWKSIKLIKNNAFSQDTFDIPNEFGGIYIYCIKPEIVLGIGCYVMYIGKASKSQSENLRTRIRSYRKQMDDSYDRERLHRLFVKWGDYVYVHYLSINAGGDVISALEDRLIAAFGKPPCNADIRVPSVKAAVRAFN
jgi:hypothetical protein